MRIAVLGGTVFIGRAIVGELVAAGHEVAVVHRGTHEPDDLPAVVHVHADRMALADVRPELDAFAADCVVDTRALTAADTDAVLDALPQDLRLVVLSSMDVYEAFADVNAGLARFAVPLTETSPVRAERYPYRGKVPGMDDYDKLDVEERYLGRGGVALRLPAVYGPHDYQRREEPILRRVRAGRERIPFGPGNWLWSRAFVGEVARATRLACEADGVRGEAIDVCEQGTWTMRQWAEAVLRAAGSDAELVSVAEDVLPPDLGISAAIGQHAVHWPAKAERLLGFVHADPEACTGTSVGWHLANPPAEPDGGHDWSADDDALASVAPAT